MDLGRTRTAGLLLFGGGLYAALFTMFSLGIGGVLASVETFFEDHHWLAHLAEAIAMGPLALGIAGAYGHYRRRLGRLGRVGAYVAAGGIGLEALAGIFIAIAEPSTGIHTEDGIAMGLTHGPGVVGNFLGGLLFGVALLRAETLPRRVAVPFAALAIGGLLMMFAPIGEGPRLFLTAVVALAWTWLGFGLLDPAPRPTAQPRQREAVGL